MLRETEWICCCKINAHVCSGLPTLLLSALYNGGRGGAAKLRTRERKSCPTGKGTRPLRRRRAFILQAPVPLAASVVCSLHQCEGSLIILTLGWCAPPMLAYIGPKWCTRRSPHPSPARINTSRRDLSITHPQTSPRPPPTMTRSHSSKCTRPHPRTLYTWAAGPGPSTCKSVTFCAMSGIRGGRSRLT